MFYYWDLYRGSNYIKYASKDDYDSGADSEFRKREKEIVQALQEENRCAAIEVLAVDDLFLTINFQKIVYAYRYIGRDIGSIKGTMLLTKAASNKKRIVHTCERQNKRINARARHSTKKLVYKKIKSKQLKSQRRMQQKKNRDK